MYYRKSHGSLLRYPLSNMPGHISSTRLSSSVNMQKYISGTKNLMMLRLSGDKLPEGRGRPLKSNIGTFWSAPCKPAQWKLGLEVTLASRIKSALSCLYGIT